MKALWYGREQVLFLENSLSFFSQDIVQTVLDLLCLDDQSLVQDFRADTMPEPICGVSKSATSHPSFFHMRFFFFLARSKTAAKVFACRHFQESER